MKSYRFKLTLELINSWIYNKKKINKKYIHFKKWFYKINELIKYLSIWKEIKTFSKKMYKFSKILGVTRQTVRLRIIKRKILFLEDWFYEKDKLLEKLLNFNDLNNK